MQTKAPVNKEHIEGSPVQKEKNKPRQEWQPNLSRFREYVASTES